MILHKFLLLNSPALAMAILQHKISQSFKVSDIELQQIWNYLIWKYIFNA